MSETFRSGEWYRIAQSLPRLARDVEVRRHVYLGRPWFVLSNATGGKVHRLTPAAYTIVGRMDGRTALEEIWRQAVAEHGEDAPSQDEIVRIVSQLHSSDLLGGVERPMLEDLVERRDKDRRQALMKVLLNPLSATIPLVDPDRFLKWLAGVMAILPSGAWWGLGLVLVASALAVLPAHLPALLDRGLEGFLDLENLIAVALIYPVVKAIHEIGHGVAIRSRGGEVHEMGVILIAFYPLPYVEGSASLAFPSKWSRAAVAAAGVAVELCIAAIALFVWIDSEPGLVRSVAYNTMVIAGFSTLFINANPLMRFDGYHVLADLIEIPNLSKRANAWWGELVRTRILGTREPDRAPITSWERLWFAFYAPAAFVYRIAISLSIALFVAGTYRFVGIVLAVWSLALTLVWPAIKALSVLWTDYRIAQAGARAWAGGGVAVAIALSILFIPAPHRVVGQGVVWLPPEAMIRARSSGQISAIHVANGERVDAGAPLLQLTAPEMEAEFAARQSRLERLRTRLVAVRFQDRARTADLEASLAVAERTVADMQARIAALTIVADVPGEVDMPTLEDSRGRFLREGEVAGYVLPQGGAIIRALVRQDDVDLVRNRLKAIDIQFAHRPSTVLRGRIVREIPGGTRDLPSTVLSLDGGGPFATADSGDGRPQALERLFQFDIALDGEAGHSAPFGMRSFVRFDLEPMPLAYQAARAMRSTFLRLFGS